MLLTVFLDDTATRYCIWSQIKVCSLSITSPALYQLSHALMFFDEDVSLQTMVKTSTDLSFCWYYRPILDLFNVLLSVQDNDTYRSLGKLRGSNWS